VKRTALKRKKGIPRTSERQDKEIELRIIVREMLMIEQGGKCAECKQKPDWRGLQLSHTIPLARGGKTDTENCRLLCARCHSARHGIIEHNIRA